MIGFDKEWFEKATKSLEILRTKEPILIIADAYEEGRKSAKNKSKNEAFVKYINKVIKENT